LLRINNYDKKLWGISALEFAALGVVALQLWKGAAFNLG
jgi:hypothetical protein